jgi:hypothetical protein
LGAERLRKPEIPVGTGFTETRRPLPWPPVVD